MIRIKKYHLCVNHPRCDWPGSFEEQGPCPTCGKDTYETPAISNGGMMAYRLGRNLIVKNTWWFEVPEHLTRGTVTVEKADIIDLVEFAEDEFSSDF